MGYLLRVLVFITALSSEAAVLSPTSQEVQFSYTAEFQTREAAGAESLALKHAQHWYGYLQSPALVKEYEINERTHGVGAPSWPPQIEIVAIEQGLSTQTIRYRAQGHFLVNKNMAKQILRRGKFESYLPFDLDNYADPRCTEWENPPDDITAGFWYYYNPFHLGCESLIQPPLARATEVTIQDTHPLDEDLRIPFDKLRGHNGNGEVFDVVTINGFNESSADNDEGRIAFDEINDWLEGLNFTKTEVQRYNNRPIFRFEKSMKRADGSEIQVRVTRLLAETDISKRNVTFAKFFRQAIETADVVLFAGHSGADASLDLRELELKSGAIEFNQSKQQLFFFDACSSYSYYLQMFRGKKPAGTLDVLTFGLTSQFGYERYTHKAFIRYLLDTKSDDARWMDLMIDMEKSLRGSTFMLNLYQL